MIGGIVVETRASRYTDEKDLENIKSRRTDKNRYLYDEINNKIGYEEIVGISSYGEVDLNNLKTIKTREEYQKQKDFINLNRIKEDKNNENISKNDNAEKSFDINLVLEEAKKNRVEDNDELMKKRKFQNMEYNILSDLNKKYITKKEKIEDDLEKEGIRELIDTITSNSLAKDLKDIVDVKSDVNESDDDSNTEDDLMSDLLATNTMNAVEGIPLGEDIAKEILNIPDEENKDEVVNENGVLVNSFYTKSMDLSEQDFEFRDEIMEENKAKRKILILVILIILVILAILSIFILKKIEMI